MGRLMVAHLTRFFPKGSDGTHFGHFCLSFLISRIPDFILLPDLSRHLYRNPLPAISFPLHPIATDGLQKLHTVHPNDKLTRFYFFNSFPTSPNLILSFGQMILVKSKTTLAIVSPVVAPSILFVPA